MNATILGTLEIQLCSACYARAAEEPRLAYFDGRKPQKVKVDVCRGRFVWPIKLRRHRSTFTCLPLLCVCFSLCSSFDAVVHRVIPACPATMQAGVMLAFCPFLMEPQCRDLKAKGLQNSLKRLCFRVLGEPHLGGFQNKVPRSEVEPGETCFSHHLLICPGSPTRPTQNCGKGPSGSQKSASVSPTFTDIQGKRVMFITRDLKLVPERVGGIILQSRSEAGRGSHSSLQLPARSYGTARLGYPQLHGYRILSQPKTG